MIRQAVLTVFLLSACPALADESGQFTVSFGGLRAGILAFEATETGGRYEMRGAARPSGLIGAVFDARVDSVAQGRVQGNRYSPGIAKEITRDGDDVTEKVFRFSGGIPTVTRTPAKPPAPEAARAAQQAGTVDTTTAAYAILRDRPADLACTLDISIFDGTRRHRVTLNRPERRGDTIVCTGQYSRVAGFDAEDMAERQHWPLQMQYDRMADGGYRVTRLSFPTSFGTARIVRR